MLDKYFKNSFWIVLGQVASMAIGLLLSVLLGRMTSKETFGEYNYITSVFSLLLIFSIPGISSVVYRSLLNGNDGTYLHSIKKSIHTGLWAVILFFALATYYYFVKHEYGLAISFFLLAFLFPFYHPMQLWVNLLNAHERFKEVNLFSTIVLVINFLAIFLVLIYLPQQIEYLVLASFASVLLVNTYYYFKTKRFIRNDNMEEGWYKSSLKLSIPSLFSQFYAYIDKVVLMMFFGAEMLAVYSIAVIPAEKINHFIGALIRLFLPALYSTPTKELKRYFLRYSWYFFLISALFLSVLYWLTEFIIELLYTSAYSDSIYAAQLYLLIIPFYLLTAFAGNVLIRDRRENFFSISVVISSIVNLGAYFVLIPIYGIVGGVIGSVLYYFTQSAIRIYFIYKYL